MAIKDRYVREQQCFTKRGIGALLSVFDDGELDTIINQLKGYNIVREIDTEKPYDISDFEINRNILNSDHLFYSFKFVGLVSIGDVILKCYPKYIDKINVTNGIPSESDKKYLNEILKNIFRVLLKYQKSLKRTLNIIDDENTSKPYNLLPLMIYFLLDYYENGLYTSSKFTTDINGSGEILWDKTINNSFSYLSDNIPYYFELFTKKRVNDEKEFYRLIHQSIITRCSRYLSDDGLGILNLFDIPDVEFSCPDLEEIGDESYIVYRLNSELTQVYDSRRQELLKKMIDFVSGNYYLENSFTFYGTSSFNLVWEAVCSYVFNNMLDKPLKEFLSFLPSSQLDYEFSDNKNVTLKDLIEKPKWFRNGESRPYYAKDTLKPDIASIQYLQPSPITISVYGNTYEFTIFDAKYYCIKFDDSDGGRNILYQPGIADVTKQYLYQLAYMELIQSYNKTVPGSIIMNNCFIMPKEDDYPLVTISGKVSMNMLNRINLNEIVIYQISANKMYDYYLNGRKCRIKNETLVVI